MDKKLGEDASMASAKKERRELAKPGTELGSWMTTLVPLSLAARQAGKET